MPRVVVLGCGTGVGKTRVSVALLRELSLQGYPTVGLKPVESGCDPRVPGPAPGSDAHALAQASSVRVPIADHPLYSLTRPVSPHLAAREQGLEISLTSVGTWLRRVENEVTLRVLSHMATWTLIETAGGVFSPLSGVATNFDLALALQPAIWVLVAADALGVLHELSATLQAMRARGRSPDHVVLSAARYPDASTGSNANELHSLGIATTSAVLGRDDDSGIESLVRRLLAIEPRAS